MKSKSLIITLAFICILLATLVTYYATNLYAVSTKEFDLVLVCAIAGLCLSAAIIIVIVSHKRDTEEEIIPPTQQGEAQLQTEDVFSKEEMRHYIEERVDALDTLMSSQSKNGINYRINKARMAELDDVYKLVRD